MEQILKKWAEEQGNLLKPEQIDSILKFTTLLYKENQKYNLTGYKTIEDILIKLVIGSLNPIKHLSVPHGTLFADIGSGAGIPGIPLAILFQHINGILIDSNHKKTDFIIQTIDTIKLTNIKTINNRIEELDESFLECFDLIFSRALGNPYLVSEMTAPFLKIGGLLYIYANQTVDNLHKDIIAHAARVGFSTAHLIEYGFSDNGYLFKKNSVTNKNYPRRFAVIKREARKFNEM